MKLIERAILPVAVAINAGLIPAVQAEERRNFMLEEVVITAQKRNESAQDVPISISVMGTEMIENTGADEIGDIIMMIPGFSGTSPVGTLNFWAI